MPPWPTTLPAPGDVAVLQQIAQAAGANASLMIANVAISLPQPDGTVTALGAVASPVPTAGSVDRAYVVAGRLPDPSRADELVVNESAAAHLHLHPGSAVDVGLFGASQAGNSGEGSPPAPLLDVPMTVTGIVRYTADLERSPDAQPGTEFETSSDRVSLSDGFWPVFGSRITVDFMGMAVRLPDGPARFTRLTDADRAAVERPLHREPRRQLHPEPTGLGPGHRPAGRGAPRGRAGRRHRRGRADRAGPRPGGHEPIERAPDTGRAGHDQAPGDRRGGAGHDPGGDRRGRGGADRRGRALAAGTGRDRPERRASPPGERQLGRRRDGRRRRGDGDAGCGGPRRMVERPAPPGSRPQQAGYARRVPARSAGAAHDGRGSRRRSVVVGRRDRTPSPGAGGAGRGGDHCGRCLGRALQSQRPPGHGRATGLGLGRAGRRHHLARWRRRRDGCTQRRS